MTPESEEVGRLDAKTDREILIELRTDQKWIKEKLGVICASQKDHEDRIRELEKYDAHAQGSDGTKKEGNAMVIAVIALLCSIVSSIAAIAILFVK